MRSKWLCEECPHLLSIQAKAANCRQLERGMVRALQKQCPTHLFSALLMKEYFDRQKMLTSLKSQSLNFGEEEKVM